jgi:hypothetical protein
MVKSKKSAALNKETTLENALKQDNVVDMRSFFQFHNKSDDYWMAATILSIDNTTEKQKIRLARMVITNDNAMGFFFKYLYGVENE